MTLRELLHAVKDASDAILDSDICVRLEADQGSFKSVVATAGVYAENLYIGPDGVIPQSEAWGEYGFQMEIPESEFNRTHDILIPANALVLDLLPTTKNPVKDRDHDCYIPHFKLEHE